MVSISKISNNKDDLIDKEKNWMHRLNIHAVNCFAIKNWKNGLLGWTSLNLRTSLENERFLNCFFTEPRKGIREEWEEEELSLIPAGKLR